MMNKKCEVCSKDYKVIGTCKECGRKMCEACNNKKHKGYCNDCKNQE